MGIRPIVSLCESATENISHFLDYWLQPIMKSLPSYIKDTSQLINELKELKVDPHSFLVTIDVKSLYTCIPHSEGINPFMAITAIWRFDGITHAAKLR